MPFILRVVRKSKWYKTPDVPWLAQGELQADALCDLSTKNNTLSVWLVADDRSNLEQIAAALAANRELITNLDYALLDVRFLSDTHIDIQQTVGASPDETANDSWHHDLVELSAFKLMELAKIIFAKAEIKRFSDKEILRLLAQAVRAKKIDRTKMKLKLEVRAKIDELMKAEGIDV